MGRRSDFKKDDKMVAWDMDAGCRHCCNQESPSRRRLKKRLRRRARRMIDRRQFQGEMQ